MTIKNKIIVCLLFTFSSFAVSAAILDKKEVADADLSLLQDEAATFHSIGMGIALSIAQCDGIDLCSLTVEEDEIQELIKTLDSRIDSLVLKQEEAEDPVTFDKVLTAYINERDNYSAHLEKLRNMGTPLDDDFDLLEGAVGIEPEEDFPVDSARNEELLDYLNELELFEDEEIEDDEDLDDLPDLPELEDIDSTP
jgi:hypothetical protein